MKTKKTMRASSVLAAGALALMSVSALAQMTPGPRDPYTQGGATAAPVDPSTSGARAGDKFDPYSQGAVQSTRQDLAPQQQQQMQMQSQQYDLVPGAVTTGRSYGSAAYQGDMRWTTPNLGRPLGERNRYLDGA